MRIRVPPKKVRERSFLIYELEGCQKAVNFLTDYYGVRKMKIILNGRKVGNGFVASYYKNKACFAKRGLKKQTVLHELYHHFACVKSLKMPSRKEEVAANGFARDFLASTLCVTD